MYHDKIASANCVQGYRIQAERVWPSLCHVFEDLLDRLCYNSNSYRHVMPGLEKYRQLIEQFGGPESVLELVMACIEPSVLGHEGKKITPDRYESCLNRFKVMLLTSCLAFTQYGMSNPM